MASSARILLPNDGINETEKSRFLCTYCNEFFNNDYELQVHCRSDTHQSIIMSDCGGNWTYRPPPRGLVAEQYSLCQRFFNSGTCDFGEQCCEAHSETELAEWKTRFQFRQTKIQQAKDKKLGGNLYSEQLIENWMQASCPQKVMSESLDYVQLDIDNDLYATMSTKRSNRDWTFTLLSKVMIHHVALLYDAQQAHFSISSITGSISPKQSKRYPIESDCQEWTNPDYVAFTEYLQFEYIIKINFKTDIYGTFRQTIAFDFGRPPVLIQRVCVDVVPVTELEKLVETQDFVVSQTDRWHDGNKEIIYFEPRIWPMSEEELSLLNFYEPPSSKLIVTQCVMDKLLTKENYASRMHELLAVEEMARFEQMSRFNIASKLQVTSAYMLAPSLNSTAKYSVNNELYARIKLSAVLSEDTPAGRLVLTNCNSALIAPIETKGYENKVYEALIEDKGKNFIYLKLSGQCVRELNLKSDQEFHAEVQFQLNRLPLCEMHFAVDKLPSLWMVFPDTQISPTIPWNPQRHWSDKLDSRLNPKQKEAIIAITTPLNMHLPPVLIVGPYGTGKTFTLAQAIKQIISQPLNRVLVCTHSNSAADLYIREYLHSFVLQGNTECRPLRIYYRNRWVQTVSTIVLQYCLLDEKTQNTTFCLPTVEDIQRHRVIVATLSTSRYLAHLGLRRGFFTHILLDEAAQAMECEAIMPFALADENTRIVLAGDHMQLSPEVHSPFARDRGLHVSLLERLYDSYPKRFSCCIMLCENYRSHEAIIHLTSELFYDRQLIAGGKQPTHHLFFPLTFFTARGEDVQEQNSTAFYNNSEVYEIVERVAELVKLWPKSWGKQDENSIGIVSPYADQVFRIRAELRKRRLYSISVERVLNVQGKQFRAIFLSTVRTRHTCNGSDAKDDGTDLGFLSNAKLLNTAITRAQSLVAVVGDPIALCSLGKCRKLWERFIELCQENKSLFGITWNAIRAQLDGMELKSSYVLNPLAPEFVPNRLRHGDPPTYLASYMGPHGMVFYPQQQQQQQQQQQLLTITPNTNTSAAAAAAAAAAPPQTPSRPCYMPGIQPHGLPLYSYPLSYLYGMSPHYLGAPMLMPPTPYPGWNVAAHGGIAKRIVGPTTVTPLASPQGNDQAKKPMELMQADQQRALRRPPEDAVVNHRVRTPMVMRMPPFPSSNRQRQDDNRPNGYCVDSSAFKWTNGIHKEPSPNKQFTFLPGVHLPRPNATVQMVKSSDEPEAESWDTHVEHVRQHVAQCHLDTEEIADNLPIDPSLLEPPDFEPVQMANTNFNGSAAAAASCRLFERRPSRPISVECESNKHHRGGGDFWLDQNVQHIQHLQRPIPLQPQQHHHQQQQQQQQPPPPPPPTASRHTVREEMPADCLWNLVRDSSQRDDPSNSNWPSLKPLPHRQPPPTQQQQQQPQPPTQPQPLYMRQSNRGAVKRENNRDVFLLSMPNTDMSINSNGYRPDVGVDDPIIAVNLDNAYPNGFPLSYAGALRAEKSEHKLQVSDTSVEKMASAGLYKHFY